LITDYTTYGYLADVFVIEEHQGKGLGKWLIQCITSEPELQSLRRWGLATQDAHALYEKYGFRRIQKPEIFMEIHRPDIYRKQNR
jgi:GNAT superfamily N-acetyltransferase